MLADKRARAAEWRRDLIQNPEAWEAHKAKVRAWYHSLSPEDRERIFLLATAAADEKMMATFRYIQVFVLKGII